MNKNNPELRFNEFTKNWEKSKLEDLTELITKGTTPIDKLWKGPVNYIKTESINPYNGNINMKSNTSLEEHEGHLKRSQLKIGDILFSIVGTLGRVGLVEEKDIPANTNQQIAIIRLNAAVDNYVLNVLKTSKVTSFINSDATIGAQPSLSLWQIKKITLLYPEIKEQTKIGEFFKQLDDIITLQQQLLNDHKHLKKAMLQKMFPQKGESVPRIRFAGFTDNWEQRKLGEVSPLRGGFAFQSTKFQLKGIPIIRITNILSNERVGGNYVYYEQQENDSKYSLPDKSAILAMSGATTGKVSVLDNPNNEKIYQNQRVGYFKDLGIVNYTFISTIVKSNLFINQLKSVLVAGAQPNISSKEIDEFYFYFPTEKEEQTKIGDFFKQLDETIVLHKKKLETYQNLKKAMLQKMFV